jgi:hypothetical protein
MDRRYLRYGDIGNNLLKVPCVARQMLGLFDSEHDWYRAFVECLASIGRLLLAEQSHGDRERAGFNDAYEYSVGGITLRKYVVHAYETSYWQPIAQTTSVVPDGGKGARCDSQ